MISFLIDATCSINFKKIKMKTVLITGTNKHWFRNRQTAFKKRIVTFKRRRVVKELNENGYETSKK
jgi:hypothetical protein